MQKKWYYWGGLFRDFKLSDRASVLYIVHIRESGSSVDIKVGSSGLASVFSHLASYIIILYVQKKM